MRIRARHSPTEYKENNQDGIQHVFSSHIDLLENLAYHGNHEEVFSCYRRLPQKEREICAKKDILFSVVIGGAESLQKMKRYQDTVHISNMVDFVNDILRQYISLCQISAFLPRELFHAVLTWSTQLFNLLYHDQAIKYCEEATALGIRNYPDLYSSCMLLKANVLTSAGHVELSKRILHDLARRPYLFLNRHLTPSIFFNLAKSMMEIGKPIIYIKLLFYGMRLFYTDFDKRRLFVDQITNTHTNILQVVSSRHVGITEKLLYLFHRITYALHDSWLARKFHVSKMIRFSMLGFIYVMNLVKDSFNVKKYHLLFSDEAGDENVIEHPNMKHNKKTDILVTRAMGGIGDLLMMTPGLRMLKTIHTNAEIHFAIPRKYFPLFYGNDDIRLVDIDESVIDLRSYFKWYNLTDCPAAKVESRTAPKVRKNRIDIFSRAMGIRAMTRLIMDKKPQYVISDAEKHKAQLFLERQGLQGRTLVGIQLFAEESYRDYPYMDELTRLICNEIPLLLFSSSPIPGFKYLNVVKVDSLSMREAFALASLCNVIIGPDSSFCHVAAALDIPFILISGPIDGELRKKSYKKCINMDVRSKLPCIPCWRNEFSPCKLTGNRTSICMRSIPVHDLYRELLNVVNHEGHVPSYSGKQNR